MNMNRIGRQTLVFPSRPLILSYSSVVGPKEGEGNLGSFFDEIVPDDLMGQDSYEKAELKMLEDACDRTLSKVRKLACDIDVYLGGDLLNQIVSSAYAARGLGIPYLGVYGACSSMAQAMLLGASLIDGGYADTALCSAVSHFSTAERQYRFPLELGNQRPPCSQWTVTGAGAILFGREKGLPISVTHATIGSVWDMGQKDINNMGAAMAPAAHETLKAHLFDLNCDVTAYDLIVTGDLGKVGSALFRELCEREGIYLGVRYIDCGCEIYRDDQGVFSGGSGAGCSAVTLCGWLLARMLSGELKKILFMPTGALMSVTTSQQGESIPGIAHAVTLEVTK